MIVDPRALGAVRGRRRRSSRVSALMAIGAGMLVTGLALYLPGRRALGREVSGERREMAVERTRRLAARCGWTTSRWRVAAVGDRDRAADGGVRRAAPASVSTGQATSLRSVPAAAAADRLVRGDAALGARLRGVGDAPPVTGPPRFGPLVSGILSRSLSRRSRALASGSRRRRAGGRLRHRPGGLRRDLRRRQGRRRRVHGRARTCGSRRARSAAGRTRPPSRRSLGSPGSPA